MILDIHTSLGHWPFRRIPGQTPGELRAILEMAGISGAAVANTHGLFYKNCQDANLELAEWLAPHGDFFVGVATLNPLYAAWERDLAACVDDLGLRALRLAPQYHDYRLDGSEALALSGLAAERGTVLMIPHRVVDVRQHHWLDTERTIALEEIAALLDAVPQARVIVTESSYPAAALLQEDGSPRYPGLYLESSRLRLDDLPEEFCATQVVFGSGAPFKHTRPALLKLEIADLAPSSRTRIAAENGRALLGIQVPRALDPSVAPLRSDCSQT
jgi:predicted TIM-barrel fold metal-dependent hydrolase